MNMLLPSLVIESTLGAQSDTHASEISLHFFKKKQLILCCMLAVA